LQGEAEGVPPKPKKIGKDYISVVDMWMRAKGFKDARTQAWVDWVVDEYMAEATT
jgi:hypothetical protein